MAMKLKRNIRSAPFRLLANPVNALMYFSRSRHQVIATPVKTRARKRGADTLGMILVEWNRQVGRCEQ